MAKTFKLAQAIADQVSSNHSAIGHAQHFAGHRERLTQEIVNRAPAGGAGRLCLLGAGNAYDVDLPALAAAFAEIHLVDVDRASVEGARAAAAPEVAQRLTLHAPVDVSGVFDQFEGWAMNPPAPAQHAAIVDAAVARVTGALPGPFDVVVSCCVLTQIQLALLQVVSDRNPRFADLRTLIGRIHMRVLARLAAPQGRALLVSDLTSNDTYPLETLAGDEAVLRPLMEHLLSVGNVIHSAHPGLLSAEIRRNAEWSAKYEVSAPIEPWLWRNGPEKTYLVYAMEIRPR